MTSQIYTHKNELPKQNENFSIKMDEGGVQNRLLNPLTKRFSKQYLKYTSRSAAGFRVRVKNSYPHHFRDRGNRWVKA